MPWKETCAMDERKNFIEAWKSRKFSKSALCRRFGVSRPTGDKWINRVLAEGQAGLVDRSRSAHQRPNQTPEPVVRALLKAKHQHPDWGPRTLRRVRADGSIRWQGQLIYVSVALTGEPVGLCPIGDDQWQLYYARLALGVLDDRLRRIIRPS